ncbi:MAG: hypothetical protein M3Q98_00055 [Actinomycetota bacterium]|nr:hypothetical protein [Actinomycetota bacterium]
MKGTPKGFEYVRRGEDIVIFHHGKKATVLRGDRVTQFDKDIKHIDPQKLMARLTGDYKRGNERTAKNHPRNQQRS